MKNFKRFLSLAVILSSAAVAFPLMAAPPLPKEAYIKAYAEMGKATAIWSASQTSRANAQNNAITAWVDAQVKIINAKAAWITAVAQANATNATALQTLEQVRTLSLDNNLKKAKTFYEKRTLHKSNPASTVRKRVTQEDISRYSKSLIPKRPDRHQLDQIQGKILWPEILQGERFLEYRLQMEFLFVQRSTLQNGITSGVHRQVKDLSTQMYVELRSLVREVTPAEYLEARKFIDSLAFESRFPQRIEGLVNN